MLKANSCDRYRRIKKNDIVPKRDRRVGGGRTTAHTKYLNLDEAFLSVISDHIAGDPMDENIRWVKLTRKQICLDLKKKGILISKNIVKKLLKLHGFVKRKIQRKKSTGKFQNRDEQFQNIDKIKSHYMNTANPVLSVDTKKKEKLGNLYREGSVYCNQAVESFDHDYAHLSTGTVVPHGIYDMKTNEALITIGTSNETAEFVCDAIKHWWNRIGKNRYRLATEILIFCDAGGANSYRHHVFKVQLQKLSNSIGLPVRICHYPPYASKWNPIEHRLFPHVTRSMEGVKLESLDQVKDLIRETKTSTGLKVFVRTTKKIYQKGLKLAKDLVDKINITKHAILGDLNYTISPQESKC